METGQKPTSLFVVGANHRSSPIGLRDRVFVDEVSAPLFFDQLRRFSITQALILSTCDRVEVQGASDNPRSAIAAIREILTERAPVDVQALAAHSDDPFYHMSGSAAVRQIFAVASSLDSQIIGEPQVLGQVKESHRQSQSHGMIGPELDTVLQAAYSVAKRVRTETDVGRRPVSIATAAAQLVRDIHGDMSRTTVLVLGLGDMANIIGDHLRDAGADRMLLTGPSQRTEATARREGKTFVPFDELRVALAQADVVVAEVGTGRYMIPKPLMALALRERRRRPVLLVDVGAPPDIDPAIQDLDGAFLYALDDLEAVALQGRASRDAAALSAWEIVDAAVLNWERQMQGKTAKPAIVALRSQFEEAREAVLLENPAADAEEATRLLVNRLLHAPSRALREVSEGVDVAENDPKTMMYWVRRLFGSDAPESER
jgi:glutamyl-tRNA reductase